MGLRRPRSSEDELLKDNLFPAPAPTPVPRSRPQRTRAPSPLARLSALSTAMGRGDEDDAPSRMQPPEDQVGYAVALAMVVIGIIFLNVHGKGSPQHPHTWAQIIGVALAAATPVAIFRYANRFITAIMIVGSSLMISLVSPPRTWIGLFYVLLIGALGFAFWLTRRQSKAARAQGSARRGAGPGRGGGRGGAAGTRGTGGRRNEPKVAAGPGPNRRYTPPQSPRDRPKRSEVAAPPPPPRTSRRKQRGQAAGEKTPKAAKDR